MTGPEQPGRGRRRGESEPTEELGWIADLRSARDSQADLGPGLDEDGSPLARRGRAARRRASEADLASRPQPEPGPTGPAGGRGANRQPRTPASGEQRAVPVEPAPRPVSGGPAPRSSSGPPASRSVSGPPAPRSVSGPPSGSGGFGGSAPPAPRSPQQGSPQSGSPAPAARPQGPGSRFVSMRGVRGNTGAQPAVPPAGASPAAAPAPAASPVPPPGPATAPLPRQPTARPRRGGDDLGPDERSAFPEHGPGRPPAASGMGESRHGGGDGPRHRTGEQPRVLGDGPRHRTGEQPAVRGERPGRPGGEPPRPVPPNDVRPTRPGAPGPGGPGGPGIPGGPRIAGGPAIPVIPAGPPAGGPRPPGPAVRPEGPRGAPPVGPRIEPPVRQEPATPLKRTEPMRTEPVRGQSAGRGADENAHLAPVSELPDETRRMRLTALVGLVLVLLVALPAFVLIRDSAKDPVAAQLDALSLPAWSAVAHDDQNSGSRWCIQTCRWHERTWRSTKAAKDTDPAYRNALSSAGWTPLTTGCPAAPGTGQYSCWQHEQYRLDMWTRDAVCGLAGVVPSPGASLPPSGSPSAGTDLLPVPGASPSPPATCNGALVTAKVADRIDPHWQDR